MFAEHRIMTLAFTTLRPLNQQESLRPLGRSVLDLGEVCKSNKSAPYETLGVGRGTVLLPP